MKIRSCLTTDAHQLVEIYNHFILNSTATFEEAIIDVDEMINRIASISSNYPFLVCESDKQIMGYAYAVRWKERSAYRYSVETTIYVRPNHQREGVGRLLYLELLEQLSLRGFHCGLAGITLPNRPSVEFHESLGFEKVGQLKQVGFKFGERIDLGYWQIIL